MKKTVIFAIAIVVVLMTTIGFATGTVQKVFEETQLFSVKTEQDPEELRKDNERREKINDRIAGDTEWEEMSKFDQMLLVLDATIENPIEYNNIIYNYEYFRQAYHFTQEQLDFISDMIIKGYDADDIFSICYFWTDTNEDIEIVEDIYLLKGPDRGVNWIENAFNEATKDKCGVLTEEDVEEYMKNGASVEDILLANKLCRKGVLTIQEILDMYIDGKTFAEITLIVNGENADNIPKEIINQNKAQTWSLREENKNASEAVISAEVIKKAEELVHIDGKSRVEYYEQELNGKSIEDTLKNELKVIENKINKNLHSNGFYKKVSTEDEIEYLKKESNYEDK